MSLEERTLGSLICRPLVSVTCDTTVRAAISIARRKHIHHLPVTRDAALVGIVCTCDLRAAPSDAPLEDLMHAPVSLERSASLLQAAQLMTEEDVGSVIVTDEAGVAGIITRGDLLQADAALAGAMSKARCACCGLTRHLHHDAEGRTLCIYCMEGEADERDVNMESSAIGIAQRCSVMHALGSLIKEHQVITRLINGLEVYAGRLLEREPSIAEASDLYAFARVFRGYADELHHEKEEEILQPILTRNGFHWDDGVLAEVREEHERERYLVDVLEQAAECELEWTREDRRSISATAMAFVTFQREHLAKENHSLFPEVTRQLGADALEQLRAELERFDSVPRHAALALELEQLAVELLERYSPAAREADAAGAPHADRAL